jgi:hypothetical protein
MFYTYAHTKPDGTIFYIGKGSKRRAWKTHNRNKHWKSIVEKHNGFNVEILANWNTEQEAFDHEVLLISCFKDMNYILANKTDGGEGASGYKHLEETKLKMKHTVSEHTKEKIRIARKGKYSGKNHPRFGKIVTEATREKIRLANLGGKNNPKTRQIKFNNQIFVGVQSLANFEKLHYKTIAYRIKTNPVKWGYEVLV